LVGLRLSEARPPADAGTTVNVAVLVTPPSDAEIVAVWFVVTVLLVIENVAVVEPAATMTVAGTVAADVLPLARLTEVSVDGAAVNVTVP